MGRPIAENLLKAGYSVAVYNSPHFENSQRNILIEPVLDRMANGPAVRNLFSRSIASFPPTH